MDPKVYELAKAFIDDASDSGELVTHGRAAAMAEELSADIQDAIEAFFWNLQKGEGDVS